MWNFYSHLEEEMQKITMNWLLVLIFGAHLCQPTLANQEFEHYLGTKTPYRVIQNLDVSRVQYEGCTPKKLWSVNRHGTRTPGESLASLMRSRLFEIRDSMVKNENCPNRLDFVAWEPHIELDDKKRLTREGEIEMTFLGQRLRKRFPEILGKQWNNSTFLFRFTDTSRTKASAHFFTRGLFGDGAADVWYPQPLKKDPILRFYKLCQKWKVKIKKNPESLNEMKTFLRSDLLVDVLTNINDRFQLPDGVLSVDDVHLMYATCCFETAWDRTKLSPWCSVLSQTEFEILEYAEDLKYYWIDGYGHELTTQMGCVMLNDVFNFFGSTNESEAVFYFTHSGTMLKFLAHLGLYRDRSKLRHDNFNTQRLWKTSRIDAFASNIVFVLFDCAGNDQVLTLHQERPVTLPGCPPNQDLCPLSLIERIYERSRLRCDFEEMCQDDISAGKSVYDSVVSKMWLAYDSLKVLYFV